MGEFLGLFEPTRIGQLKVDNRIVMPAMNTRFASVEGEVTNRMVDYYSARARGMVGTIIVEATIFDNPRGKLGLIQLRIDNDKFIPSLHALAEEIKAYGTRVFLQLNHAGARTSLEATDGIQPVSASEIPSAQPGVLTKALTCDEIAHIIAEYGKAARRARAAGFDGIEIHGAHGYLVAEFLSPYTNKRTDSYGGPLENRLRFSLELLERIQEMAGSDFPVIFRLSADEFVPGGLDVNESSLIAQKLEEVGVDALHITAGTYEEPSSFLSVAPACIPTGHLVYLANSIKKVAEIPVIAVGRINDPRIADEIIRKEQADLVAMGRALIADPELPTKAFRGEFTAIRKCLGCLHGCIELTDLAHRLSCDVNPWVGKEKDYQMLQEYRTSVPKKILVVGGGPAGMQAAIAASMKGHEVDLYEKDEALGGQLRLAATPPYKEEIQDLISYFEHIIKEVGVDVRLSTEADLDLVHEVEPDELVIATGAVPIIPQVPGASEGNVFTAWDVLGKRLKLKKNIVVAGGGQVGLETAEFLASEGASVTIIEVLSSVGQDMFSRNRFFLLERLNEHGVEILTNTRLTEITSEDVTILRNAQEKSRIQVDNVVLAVGARSNRKLLDDLKNAGLKRLVIGDCAEPRRLYQAVHEGSVLGSSL